jgi:hypothetical protein
VSRLAPSGAFLLRALSCIQLTIPFLQNMTKVFIRKTFKALFRLIFDFTVTKKTPRKACTAGEVVARLDHSKPCQ